MFTSPDGHSFRLRVRGDTNDGALVAGILATEEYPLKGLRLEGWALDIGAHVGAITFALTADHPNLRIIAVEPVPDNAELLRGSVADAHLEQRIFIEEASAADKGRSSVPCHYDYTAGEADEHYVAQNRYIGNLWRKSSSGTVIDSPVVTIAGLRAKYDVDRFAFCKIDCEGCEWKFLREGAEHIDLILGEWHDRHFPAVGRLLGKTHEVTLVTDYGGSGIFRAVRRGAK